MTSETRRNIVVVAVALVVAGLLLAGAYGTWYLFLRPAGPAAVGSTSVPVPTLAPAASSSPGASSAAGSSSAPSTDGLDGTWTVDTSIGSFADFSSSFVGYRVGETLASRSTGSVAVGRTPDVSGTLAISGTQVTDATIEADLTTLESDDDRRDGQLRQRGIQTNQFPTATFKLTSPIELGSVPSDGQEVSATANGQFTLHGVTKDVQIPLKARLSGNVIAVTGSLPITFADYGVEAPSSFVVVSIDDHGTMELQLFFTKS
jgi:polyisoprenoid-binding protein YceI